MSLQGNANQRNVSDLFKTMIFFEALKGGPTPSDNQIKNMPNIFVLAVLSP